MDFDTSFLKNLEEEIDFANKQVDNHIVVKRVALGELKEHESNFYSIESIEPLAEELKLNNGNLDNPIKCLKNNTIMSGHRRYNAFKLLEEENKAFSTIPVIYIDYFATEEEELLYLMNENNHRHKSKEDIKTEICMKKNIYTQLKQSGDEKYKNININKLLANEFNLSQTSIKRATGNTSDTKKVKSDNVLQLEKTIQEKLSTKAMITGEEKGYVKIKFESADNLKELLSQMNILIDD